MRRKAGRPPKQPETTRLEMRVSRELSDHLDELVRLGLHGNSRQEAARQLLAEGIRALIKDRHLERGQPEGR
jgi:hypothetical protein